MVIKKKYDAPELLVEEVVCNRGFEASPFEEDEYSFDNAEDDVFMYLY